MGYVDYGGGPYPAARPARTPGRTRAPRCRHAQRRRPDRRHGPPRRRGGGPRRPQGDGARWPRAAGRRLHAQRHARRARRSRSTQGQLVEVHLTNENVAGRHHPALARRRRAQRRGRRRRRHPGRRACRARSTPTASSPTRPAPTGTTPTRSRTSRCTAACSGRSWSRRAHADPRRADVVALLHTYDGVADRERRSERRPRSTAEPGQHGPGAGRSTPTTARPRVWVDGAPYRVLAVDGHDVHGPTDGRPTRPSSVTAGGRVDLEVTAPADGCASACRSARRPPCWSAGAARRAAPPPPTQDARPAALRHPGAARLRPGAGRPALRATRSAAAPASSTAGPGCGGRSTATCSRTCRCSSCSEGDVVRMHIDNHSGEVHPMHLHGHHAVVLSRDGVKATGSPWWVDSLDVADGETLRRSRSSPTTPASGWTTATTSARRAGAGRAPDVRRRHRAVPRRRRLRQRAGVAADRGRPANAMAGPAVEAYS